MYLGKSYSAHSSFIHSMEVVSNKWLITSSVSDECLFKWRVYLEENNKISDDLGDEQIDAIKKDDFTALIHDILPIRNEIMDI